MLLLPLIQRELGLRARRAGNYWSRFAVGGIAMLACVPILVSGGVSTNPGQMGSMVFDTLVVIAFVLCCLMCVVSSDVIASEKREGTLGLLFLTHVRRFDVILGKLVSSGAAALTALLVLMPFLALPMLAGGVTGGETFRKALALLNTLFLALAVGIYSSSCRLERFKAARQAAVILVALTFIPLLAQLLLPPYPVARVFSPLGTLIEAGDLHYQTPPAGWQPYWFGIIGVQATGWVFLVRAGARMGRMLRDEERPIAPTRLAKRVSLRTIPINHSGWPSISPPIEWLVRHQRGLKTIIWGGVIAGLLYYVFFRAVFSWRVGMSGFGAMAIWVPNILIGCFSGMFFAWAASRFFVEIRRSGELELLLTTPVGARTIVRDHWKVMTEALLFPLSISAVGILLPAIFTVLNRIGSASGMILFFPFLLMTIPGTVNMVVGTYALCRVGVWLGLKASGQAGAILWTLGVVKGVPYLLGLGWSLITGMLHLNTFVYGGPSAAWYLLSLVPSVATLFFYLWIIRVAKRGVQDELSGVSSMAVVTSFTRASSEIAAAFERFRNWNTA